MRTLSVCFLLGASALLAQTAETIAYRGKMLPANENPPVPVEGSASATMLLHVIRNTSGQVTSGSVDFIVNYSLPGPVTFTGLHIHGGAAGVNGPVIIDTKTTNVPSDASGKGVISRQAQVLPTDTAGLAALNGILQNPDNFYVNIHTTEFPGGVMRSQLRRAERLLLMGEMSPVNEVPAITDYNASGVAAVTVLATRGADGQIDDGVTIFDVIYSFPTQVTFVGFHIHDGGPTVAGPVTINSGINATNAAVDSAPSGAGRITYTIEVPSTGAAAFNTFKDLFVNPGLHYINLHTREYPGGIIRAALRRTERVEFNVTMLPSNEVPPITGIDASGAAKLTAYVLRSTAGGATSGMVNFDVNYRFPSGATFTGLHIHDGSSTVAGPVTINTGLSGTNTVMSDNGFGNIFLDVPIAEGAALATLNSFLANPDLHYVNLHTTVNPGGVIRAQLAGPFMGTPSVTGAVSAALSRPAVTNVAPGGLFTIFGTNLARLAGGLDGFQGAALPTALNGVQVTVGGRNAPLIFVSPTQINAQMPVDVAAGSQPLIVRARDTNAPSSTVTVANTAPAMFQVDGAAAALKNVDFSLVSPGNPALGGDIVIVYSTGLGQTTPPLTTGTLVTSPPFSNTQTTTATLGGQSLEVISSIASPGFVGLYQTAIRIPMTGVASGNQMLVITVGGVSSPAVPLAVLSQGPAR